VSIFTAMAFSRTNRSRLMAFVTLLFFGAAAMLATDIENFSLSRAPELKVREEAEALVYVWRGEVTPGMAERFETAFAETRDKSRRIVIDLHSPGGMLSEGGRVVEVVERMKATHQIETRVGPRGKCYSMCVPIFLLGETRTAAPSAEFMFHEPSTFDAVTNEAVDLPAYEQRRVTDVFFRRFFDSTEMDPSWRERLRKDLPGKDIFKSAQELVDEGSNIVERLE
jgi:ATP-dependent protease ClpP protease subunit